MICSFTLELLSLKWKKETFGRYQLFQSELNDLIIYFTTNHAKFLLTIATTALFLTLRNRLPNPKEKQKSLLLTTVTSMTSDVEYQYFFLITNTYGIFYSC